MIVQFLQVYEKEAQVLIWIILQALDTQAVWFSMLETGLALIALNLPPSWSLISRFPIGSILQSLRSLLSVGSSGSRHSDFTTTTQTKDHTYRNRWKGSDANSQSIELVPHTALADFDNKVETEQAFYPSHVNGHVEGIIKVQRSMEQTESRLV